MSDIILSQPTVLPDLPRFDLVRPCGDCPFRRDTPCHLGPDQAEALMEGMIYQGDGFMCHKTVPYDDPETYTGGRPTPDGQHCAGAMIFLEKIQEPNQLMLLALVRGTFDPSRLDMTAPVVDTQAQFREAHGVRSDNHFSDHSTAKGGDE